MEVNYFDLSGGINQATTKSEMGLNPKKVYWSDSKNVEIFANKGIKKQKGNAIILNLPEQEKIIGMTELESDSKFKLVIVTESGKIYIYSEIDGSLNLLSKTLTGTKVIFAQFLRGMLVATNKDSLFYIKDNSNYDIVECELKNKSGEVLYPDCLTIYKGRVWCSKESTIYYSALGSYTDFTTKDDAGYISDFHTDTSDIITMHTYKDYLAIYKKDRVYLLSGTSPADFSVALFADKGTFALHSIVNVDNKQFFLSNGIFALEQVGELNQIRLGSEISENIKDEFTKFDTARIAETQVVHYPDKNQIWFLFPYLDDDYYHTIWIYDYVNHAWYKRIVPQDLTKITLFHSKLISADSVGNIYQEDYGTTFNGKGIDFMWKSPFFSLGNVLKRKTVEDFYFLLDDKFDNRFNFSVYKDFDSEYKEFSEFIYSKQVKYFLWADENSPETPTYCWNDGESDTPVWAISSNSMERAEITDSNYSVQICVEGEDLADNCAIIGLQFKEIYSED